MHSSYSRTELREQIAEWMQRSKCNSKKWLMWAESRSSLEQVVNWHRRRKLSLRRRLQFSSRLLDHNLTLLRHLVWPTKWPNQAWWWETPLAAMQLGTLIGVADKHPNLRRRTQPQLIICSPRAPRSRKQCFLWRILQALVGSMLLR